MTVDKTIKQMMRNHPGLFQQRWQCLNQLFCVLGNGLDWVDGEMVLDDPYDKMTKREIDIEGAKSLEWSIYKWRKIQKRMIASAKIEPMHFYSDGKHLCELPVNAKPDWVAAWLETKELIPKAMP